MRIDDEKINKLKSMIARIIKKDENEITDDSDFIADLGADSLGLIELIFQVEEFFNIKISDSDLQNLRSLNKIKEYIKSLPE